MVEGPNFYFGHNREGTIERLGKMTERGRDDARYRSAGGTSTGSSFRARSFAG